MAWWREQYHGGPWHEVLASGFGGRSDHRAVYEKRREPDGRSARRRTSRGWSRDPAEFYGLEGPGRSSTP